MDIMIVQHADTGIYIFPAWMTMKYLCKSVYVMVKIMKRKSRGGERNASTKRHNNVKAG